MNVGETTLNKCIGPDLAVTVRFVSGEKSIKNIVKEDPSRARHCSSGTAGTN